MTEEETIEVYFTKGVHLDTTFDEPGSGLILVQVEEGERFSSRLVVRVNDFGGKNFRLVLSWSPSRAGDERISWSKLDGKTIDASKHPLYGTKNEQAGLYHETLPAGCYVIRDETSLD